MKKSFVFRICGLLMIAFLGYGCSVGLGADLPVDETGTELANGDAERCLVFPEWKVGTVYNGSYYRDTGDIVSYQGETYRCRETHTAVDHYKPGTPGLYWWEKLSDNTLTITASSGGAVKFYDGKDAVGDNPIKYGRCTLLELIPNQDYVIDSVKVDGKNVDPFTYQDYFFVPSIAIVSDMKVEVVFKKPDLSQYKNTVLTCYWTYDEKLEPVPNTNTTFPIIYAPTLYETVNGVTSEVENIGWTKPYTVKEIAVMNYEGTSNQMWFPRSGIHDSPDKYDRYEMEGCGFVRGSDGKSDGVIQLNGTEFNYTGPNTSFTDPVNHNTVTIRTGDVITLFHYISSDSSWGEAYKKSTGSTTSLDPWKTAAVTDNVTSTELYFPLLDGYQYYNPTVNSYGTRMIHDGNFDAKDSSWSFSQKELDKNEAIIDAWIDIFVARYDMFENLDNYYIKDALKYKSPYISVKPIERWVKNNGTWGWSSEDLWVAKVEADLK